MISIVIPTLNAAAYLPRCLASLVPGVMDGLVREAIVADGGSSDETRAIAEAAGCEIIDAPRGRARQMLAGAAVARGDWLLFLHADTALAPEWVAAARTLIARQEPLRAAAFRFAFDDDSAAARSVTRWTRLRGQMLKLPYGDQGLLISRRFYDALGGYRDIALMEDVDIVRRIGGARLAILDANAVTSADKYRRDGFSRRAWRNLGLMMRYLLGADPERLAKAYD
ncbi:MAG: TIGR04283 family arsenosugar biosynthesis glycosyltransferase [Hyphomonadaceae bacterium]